MKPRYLVSDIGVALIKRFEGFRARAARLDDGGWTVGYSHTRSAREGAEVSEADAEALLRYDLTAIESALNAHIYTPLTQNQFDALASFAFNIGVENFRRSAVLRRLNEGALLQAAAAMEAWRRADFDGERIVVDALVRRRAAEKALFLTPPDGFKPIPTPVIAPKLDYLGLSTPAAHATVIETPLDGETAAAVRAAELSGFDAHAAGPSPSEAAANALRTRLEGLITDLDERPIAEPDEFPMADEAEVRPFGALGIEPEPAFDPALRPRPAPPAETTARAPDRVRDRVGGDTVEPVGWSVFGAPPAEPVGLSLVPLAVLGLLGLVMFAGAVFWMFNARLAGGLAGPLGLGAVVAIVGVLCVVSAIYFLLERLAGRER